MAKTVMANEKSFHFQSIFIVVYRRNKNVGSSQIEHGMTWRYPHLQVAFRIFCFHIASKYWILKNSCSVRKAVMKVWPHRIILLLPRRRQKQNSLSAIITSRQVFSQSKIISLPTQLKITEITTPMSFEILWNQLLNRRQCGYSFIT